jgi:hypothetical protein
VISAVAVVGLSVTLTGCGNTPFDAASSAPPSSTTASSAQGSVDREAALARILGASGFRIADSSTDTVGQQQAQVLILKGDKARATLTFQDDNPGLRGQLAGIRTLADGTEYATQHMGYGGVSVVVLRGGRAVILTLVPWTPNGDIHMSDSVVIQKAEELLDA